MFAYPCLVADYKNTDADLIALGVYGIPYLIKLFNQNILR